MTELAEIASRREGECVTIVGRGELDLRMSKELDALIADALTQAKSIQVDLREANYIDSAILSSLAKTGMALIDVGSRLQVLVARDSHPEYVLKIVGFGEVMDVVVETPAL